jgi:hypothetical protein
MANDWEQITDKIIELLKADSTLNNEIKSWCFGDRTIDRITRFPAVLVYFKGGSVEPGTATETEQMDYMVVVVHNKPRAEEDAERAAYEHARIIKDVLKADRSLGGLVATSYRIRLETDRVRFRPREGSPFSVVAVATTLHTRKKVS